MSGGEVKPGYKRTEVGVIPEDWSLTSLKEVCILHNGRAYSLHEWERSGVPVIRLQNLTGGDDYYYSTLALAENKYCDFGDLLYMWSATFGPHIWLGGRAIYHYHIWKIEPKETRSERSFLYYKLLEITEEKKARSTNGGTMLHVTKASMEATKISLPPTAEQRAIATALSDVDDLLAKLDQLIAKKRDLKQATMQQLLTGQTRLPGFSGEWGNIKISNNASLKARIGWQALTTAEYLQQGDCYLVTGTDFIDGRVNWSSCQFVDRWRYDQDHNIQLRNGDVLLTKDGTIGKVGYVEGLPGPVTLNSGIFVIRPFKNSFAPIFLFYILQSKVFDEFLASITAGSTIIHLYQKDFVNFEFMAPDIKEQLAIATFLSDMDVELKNLEARRDKTRTLKQGMMQELLTGRIRLTGRI